MSGKTISRNLRQNPTPSTPVRKFSNSNSVFSPASRVASTRSPYIHSINLLKNRQESGLTNDSVQSRLVAIYQPWKSDYIHSLKRPKSLKPMIKESYASNANIIGQAEFTIVNESETNLSLIPFSAVKIEQAIIKVHTRKKKPMIVRYLRRHEVLPSGPPTANTLTKDLTIDNLMNHRVASPSVTVEKPTPSTPKLTPIERLLYRDKLCNNQFPVRRPTRKVTFNLTHETIMPLTECS